MRGTALSVVEQEFRFDGTPVRIVMRNGDPWFVLADVCSALGIGIPSKAAERLDKDEKGRSIIRTLGGPQDMTVISEAGLYVLMMTSRKPGAKRFRKWVTSEVIPA